MLEKTIALWRQEKIRFLIVGGFNTAFGLFVFYLFEFLFGASIGYMGSLYCSFALVTVSSFLLYRFLVFKVTGKVIKDFFRFVAVYLIPLGANTIALPLLVSVVGINVYLSQTLIVVFSTVVSYLGHKYFSFRRKTSTD